MDLLYVTLDGIGEVEPAVVFVPFFANGSRRVIGGLRQALPLRHFERIEVLALLFARLLLLTGVEGQTLNTVPEKTQT